MVGPRLVLTAAHCLQPPLQMEHLRVSVGEHRLGRRDEHENIYKVDTWMPHPDFRKGKSFFYLSTVIYLNKFTFIHEPSQMKLYLT